MVARNKKNSPKFITLFLILILTVGKLSFAQAEKPYVLLVSMDGFRWDYLNRGLTPSINEYAAHGVRALTLRPSFPTKTFPNHYAIITGLEPDRNGIIDNSINDRETGKIFRLGDTSAVRNPAWYLGEPLWSVLRKNDIRSASVFWPGSEVHAPERRPDYFLHYDHYMPYQKRIDQVVEWFSLPESERPHFMTLYFSAADDLGQKFGPESVEADSAIQLLDDYFSILLKTLDSLEIATSLNIIVLSDHGMTNVSKEKMINVDDILGEEDYVSWLSGPLMLMRDDQDKLYQRLKSAENHFRVYRKAEVPPYLRYSSNPRIWPLVLIAEPGYSLTNSQKLLSMRNKPDRASHGYDNQFLDMHGIFVAGGPAFRQGMTTGTLRNVDIFPLICDIFSIVPADSLDGRLENISFLLK